MMRKYAIHGLCVLCAGVLVVGGCASLLPTVPVTVPLGSDLGQFDVQAGVPQQKSGTVNVGEFSVEAGSGNIEIPLDTITVSSGNGGGKLLLPQQQTSACSEACTGAGVDSATCDQVCTQSELLITVWIGEDVGNVCVAGDEYQATVALDDNGNPTSISVSPSQLTSSTIALLNSGSFAICVEVLSPISGQVFIDELTFNLGL